MLAIERLDEDLLSLLDGLHHLHDHCRDAAGSSRAVDIAKRR